MLGQPLESLSDGNFENLIFNYVELADNLAKEMREEEQEIGKPPRPDIQNPGIQV